MNRKLRKRLPSDDAELEIHTSFSTDFLSEAIALVYKEDPTKTKGADFGGTRVLKKCHLSSLKAHNLCSTAEIFSPEPSTVTEVLNESRLRLLEDNFAVAALLLKWLLPYSSKIFLPIIWKTSAVLFLNDFSFQGCHEEFLESCADQRFSEDKRRLFKELVSLPDVLKSRTSKSLKRGVSSLTNPTFEDSNSE